MLQHIIQCLATVLFAIDIDFLEISLFVHGHAAVIQKVGVVHLIQTALGKQETDMALKLLAMHKRLTQTLHQFCLFLRQFIRVFGINRREINIIHGIIPIPDAHGLLLIIDLV